MNNKPEFQIKAGKKFSPEETDKLWQIYFADRKNKVVREKLIVCYLHLTGYVVSRLSMMLPPSFTSEDISGYAAEGLIEAIDKFSPERKTKFETYAIFRIRGAVLDKIRALDWMPRSVKRKIKEVNDAVDILKVRLGRVPTTSETASFLKIPKEKVEMLLSENPKICSIYDKKSTAEENIEIIDTIEDTTRDTPLEALEAQSSRDGLANALKKLPERERNITILYYVKNMTLKEIGEMLNVTESRVCQLHAQAIMKLRNFLKEGKTVEVKKSGKKA